MEPEATEAREGWAERSSTAAEQEAQPPVESQIVASYSPQPTTARIMGAPSITDTPGSSQQESAERSQGTNIGA